jgi:hypothetical protein
LKELLKITYNGKEEIIDRINSTLRDLTIDCPECEVWKTTNIHVQLVGVKAMAKLESVNI